MPQTTFGQDITKKGGSIIPSNPAAIPIDAVSAEAKPYTVPDEPQQPDYLGVIGAIPTLDSILTEQKTETEKTQNSLSSSILDTLKKLGGKAEAQATAEQQTGLPQYTKQLTEVNSQLQSLQKEALAIPLQLQQDAQGRGVTAGGLAPIQTGLLRENAIKSLSLSAMAQTLQGNVALARQQVDKAIELQFAPLENQLTVLSKMYDMNKDELQREDAKRAEQLQIRLQERERLLKDIRADKQYATEISLEAARNGAPSDVVERIANATPDNALALSSSYLGAEFRQKAIQQAFENNIKLRSLAITEANSALDRKVKLLELAKAGDRGAISQLGYDPNRDANRTKADEQQIAIQRDIDIAKRARENGIGLQTSSGLIRGGIIGAFLESPGGILGAPYGAAKKNDFLADAGYIVKNMTFNKIRELADAGVKLTPISERELKAMADASSVLAASAQYDGSGNLTGFKLGENRVREQLQLIQDHYQRALDDMSVRTSLTEEDLAEINSL
jgi:hypothetical protein